MNVTSAIDVYMGGIIIGSNKTKVKAKLSENRKNTLYAEAVALRKKYLYTHNGIRLVTWDYILEQFSTETYIEKTFTGDVQEPISIL